MEQRYVIGIDAGGTKVAYGLFDLEGNLLDRTRHSTNAVADGPAFCEELIRTVRDFTQKNGVTLKEVKGVGICMPSYILFEEGKVCLTSAITGIKNFPLRDYIAERLKLPVVLDNDANAAALAEYRHGAGRGSKHMVYIATSTGIGSGLILNGELFRGSYGWAGECGHMLATPDEGVMCGCENRGCIMSHVGGLYAPEFVRGRLAAGAVSSLASADPLDGVAILKAYQNGDALAAETVKEMAHWLAVCVYNVYQLLNINLFVFGGGLVHFGDALYGRMEEEFKRYDHLHYPVEFRFAELGKDFGIIGASELVK